MKELELTLRLRNNRLKARRSALGMSQKELAAAACISHAAYAALEGLRRSSRRTRGGGWSDLALRLAAFHCVAPEELFPDAVLGVRSPEVTRQLDAADILPLLSSHQERLLETPEGALERAELRDQIQRDLSAIDTRHARVLCMRFGLEDGVERSLDDVGVELGVGRERARQIETRALQKLRQRVFARRERP